MNIQVLDMGTGARRDAKQANTRGILSRNVPVQLNMAHYTVSKGEDGILPVLEKATESGSRKITYINSTTCPHPNQPAGQ